MGNTCRFRLAITVPTMVVIAVAALFSAAAAADPASGTINLQSKGGAVAVNVANVYLVKGPDAEIGRASPER